MDIITAIVLVLVFITMEYSHNQVMKDCMKEIQYYREQKDYYIERYHEVIGGTVKETDAKEFEQAKINSAYYKARCDAWKETTKRLYKQLEEQKDTALENHTMD